LDGPVPPEELAIEFSLLVNRLEPGSSLFYTFDIPLVSGSFYIGHPVPTTSNQPLLENESSVENLISQLNQIFLIAEAEKQLAALHAIIDHWPPLVALGGEIIPFLLESAQKTGNITTQALISRLLGDIVRDTTARFGRQPSAWLCQACFVRYAAHKIYLFWLDTQLIYYGCRVCGHSRAYFDHPGPVVAVLDSEMTEFDRRDNALRVSWLAHDALFDFTQVEIGRATDEQVERFAMRVGNDTDAARRSGYRQMSCIISPTSRLSANTRRVLQHLFGQVVVE